MENIIQVLQCVSCTVNDPLEFKLEALEKLYGQYVHVLCDALKVPRGTFYNYLLRNKRDNTWYAKRQEELQSKIQQIYDDHHQIFGAAKVTALLKEQGERVSVKMVRRLMQDMGLTSIRVGAKDLYDKEQRPYKNHLNQQFDTSRPNEVWVSDITYFRFNNKNYYICVVIDLYARAVVGYRVGIKNSTQLTKSTFKSAYENRKPNEPLLFHTDRGSNYRSKTFCSYLSSLNIKQSYSRAHIPYDNSVMESFFASLKREELYRTKYRSENEFKAAIDDYIIFITSADLTRRTVTRLLRRKNRISLINTRLCRINMNRQRSSETVLFLFSVSVLNFFDFAVYINAEIVIAKSLCS